MFKLFPNPKFVPILGLSETEGSLFRFIQENILQHNDCFRVEHSESNIVPGFYKLLLSTSWAEPLICHVRDGEPYGSPIQLSKQEAELTIISI